MQHCNRNCKDYFLGTEQPLSRQHPGFGFPFVTPLAVTYSLISFLSCIPQENLTALSPCRAWEPRTKHGAEVLPEKEKNRHRFTLCQPLPGPAQRHEHVFVLLLSPGIAQQPAMPFACWRRCKKVTKDPGAGRPPAWCRHGVTH